MEMKDSNTGDRNIYIFSFLSLVGFQPLSNSIHRDHLPPHFFHLKLLDFRIQEDSDIWGVNFAVTGFKENLWSAKFDRMRDLGTGALG